MCEAGSRSNGGGALQGDELFSPKLMKGWSETKASLSTFRQRRIIEEGSSKEEIFPSELSSQEHISELTVPR